MQVESYSYRSECHDCLRWGCQGTGIESTGLMVFVRIGRKSRMWLAEMKSRDRSERKEEEGRLVCWNAAGSTSMEEMCRTYTCSMQGRFAVFGGFWIAISHGIGGSEDSR